MAAQRPHLSPKFDGTRFAKHSIPVELLADLAAYRDLVQDVAKELYKKANPDRKRVPRAFEAAFRLALKDVKEGSAVAELVNDVEVDDEDKILQFASYFEDAKTLVDDTIRSVSDEVGGTVPANFPMRLLPGFGKIGKHLKPGEVINFGFGEDKPANLTDSVRKTLVLWASNEVEASVDLIGKVTGMHNDPEDKFDIKLEDGKTVSGPYMPALEDDIVKAFRDPVEFSLRIEGYGVFNKQNRLIRLSEVNEIEVLDERDLKLLMAIRRIEEMGKLPLGWCGGEGKPLTQATIEWSVEVLKNLVEDHELPVPYVFPTPSEDIQLEWSIAGGSIDLRLNHATKIAELSAYSERRELDLAFDLATSSATDELARQVKASLADSPSSDTK